TNDGVASSFQQSRIHYQMLMLKLQRHTISIKIRESRIKKAQVLKTKTSIYSDIKDNSSETKLWLLASFQLMPSYEHVGQVQDRRSVESKSMFEIPEDCLIRNEKSKYFSGPEFRIKEEKIDELVEAKKDDDQRRRI
ncbi:hypothetical protein Tco_0914401, partial [Tanacetum coccineum]